LGGFKAGALHPVPPATIWALPCPCLFAKPPRLVVGMLVDSIMNPQSEMPKIIIVCGPTGIGKTAVAIDVAQHFNAEIINADSMQVYKFLDIGTAKPTHAEQSRVPHHMIDVVEPDEPFDAAQFSEYARAKIIELYQQGITPFVVGGTGLYIKALLYGLFKAELSDPDIRNRLKEEAALSGIGHLYERLKKLDPITARRLHPNDTYRIIRALEVSETTGKAISEYHSEHDFSEERYQALKIGLNMDRTRLYERIDARVDSMIAAGFVGEVRELLKKGYASDLKSMQSIGYRHVVDFIEGHMTRHKAIETLKRDTRRFAKRQLTWFGADNEIIWKKPEQINDIFVLVKNFLTG
jgi:tRNA dimethylallyltransferase